MKELGRFNVTREQLDLIFTEGHQSIAINTMIGTPICVSGFVIYDNEDNTKSLKIIDDAGRDYYTGSQVFIKNFILYAQSFEDDQFPITITPIEGKSKTGKKYYSIEEALSGSSDWRSIKF